jgi:hypothetical protein
MSVERGRAQLELAEGRWQTAIKEDAQPPPDAGYARRLRALADAARGRGRSGGRPRTGTPKSKASAGGPDRRGYPPGAARRAVALLARAR